MGSMSKRQKGKIEKGGVSMSKKVLGLIAVGLIIGAGIVYADNPETVDLYVTPGYQLSLTASPTYYNFGTVDLSQSTAPANAIFSLQNSGNVGVTVNKKITTEFTGWAATSSDPATLTDQYRLYIGTSAVAVPLDGFSSSCVMSTSDTALTGAGGGSVSIDPGASVDIHAQLDLPQNTSTSGQKKAVISFTAQAQ